MFYV
jgi:hypothetical protein